MALPAYVIALLVIFAVFNKGTFAQMKITACLNEELAVDCTSGSDHIWEGTALDCASIVVAPDDEEGRMYSCGSTPIVKVEGGSRLMVTADSSLDGATVVCRTVSVTVVNATVEVLETVYHTITNVMDVSDSCVELEVTTTSDPSMCFEEYIFSAVGVGNSATVDSSSSTVFTGTVCGLCSPYCGYNYTVVGRPKYGEDVVAFKNSDSECLQLESMSVDESGRTVTLFLSDTIENVMCMTVVPNGLDYTINDTDGSVTWMGFSYCTQNYNFELEFECCPPVTGSYDTSVEISLTYQVEYQCNAEVVNVNVATNATGVDIVPDLDVTIKNESGSAVGRNNIAMVYQNYTADVVASIDLCSNERQDRFVPNIIVAHEVEFNNESANISVTYAECVDDTSNFMIRVEYKREGLDPIVIQENVAMPKQTFTLLNLTSGTYHYMITVTNGVNQIGAVVNGTFTTATSSSGGLSGGAIAGIIVGLVLIAIISIALVVVGVILYIKGTTGKPGRTSDIDLDNPSGPPVDRSDPPWWKRCCS